MVLGLEYIVVLAYTQGSSCVEPVSLMVCNYVTFSFLMWLCLYRCRNRGLTAYLQRFGVDISKWLFRSMCGHAEVQTVYAGDKQTKLCLFSRLSCERAGTRLVLSMLEQEWAL